MEHIEHLLGAYHDGELLERARKRVEAHLGACSHCRAALARLEALSRTLSDYPVPGLERGAEQLRSGVLMRLGRRSSADIPSAWWYLVPALLSGTMAVALALLALPDLVRAGWASLGWLGIDLEPVRNPWVSTPLTGEAFALLRAMGALAWQAALYAVLLLLFGSYAGWVGVLWRTESQRRSGKER